MKSLEAKRLLEGIDSAIDDITGFSGISDLEKTYLAKFLVVYISGIYEEAIETMINERASKCGDPEVINYVKIMVDKFFQNPKIERINDLLISFNPTWADKLKTVPESAKAALGSIVTNKNSMAHGGNFTLTLGETIKSHKDAMLVLEEIDEIVYK